VDIKMHCGVSICGDCYEVDSDVLQGVTGQPNRTRGKLDLRAVLLDRAARTGVREQSVSPWCSSHDRELFFSHRRSGGKEARVSGLPRPRLACLLGELSSSIFWMQQRAQLARAFFSSHARRSHGIDCPGARECHGARF
jgi:hypothetical protein